MQHQLWQRVLVIDEGFMIITGRGELISKLFYVDEPYYVIPQKTLKPLRPTG